MQEIACVDQVGDGTDHGDGEGEEGGVALDCVLPKVGQSVTKLSATLVAPNSCPQPSEVRTNSSNNPMQCDRRKTLKQSDS